VDRFHDGAVACAQSILDAFPPGTFGSDKARVYFAIYVRVKAALEAVPRAEDRDRGREPTAN
jgi:hypothetical protein